MLPRRCRSFRLLSVVLICVFSAGVVSAKTDSKKPKLPKFYSNWLNRDVVYIITKPERKAFLDLDTDQARDTFIQRFWEIRNPTPGSPENTYKDEIYERIAYADARFSIGSGEDGWRTDRGRTYITLGKPQQIEKHYGAANLRPMEIWFYSNTNPALPPFFYVVFYQPDNMGDYKYYSPAMDGPDKLVSGMEAINDPKAALKIIMNSVGPEVVRVAQSLIPGEPLDPEGRPSLQSDVMLSIIKSLANQPSNIDDIKRRQQNTSITSRMIVDTKNLDITLFPVRGEAGLTRLDYVIRLHNPQDLTVSKDANGVISYAVEIRVRVLTKDKKLIFTQQKSVSGKLDQAQYDQLKNSAFGYEGLLPLSPGEYSLEFLFTDWSKKVGFSAERTVTIPGSGTETFTVPAILPFSEASAANPREEWNTPFAIAGVRFKPLSGSPLLLSPMRPLQFTYQVWAPPQTSQALPDADVSVQYALGQPSVAGSAETIKDSFKVGDFTASGAVLSGKKIALDGKPSGSYMLTVSVSGPEGRRTYASLPLQIFSDAPQSVPWDVDEPDIIADDVNGVLDQQRGLCYLANGDTNSARKWFRLALSKNHSDEVARARLVDAYYSLNSYTSIVSLLKDAGITPNTGSATVVQVAESLLKTGNAPQAESILQDYIKSRPEDGPLYLALGDYYQQLGKANEAAEMTRKGHLLIESQKLPE